MKCAGQIKRVSLNLSNSATLSINFREKAKIKKMTTFAASNNNQSKVNPNAGQGRKLMMPWHISQFKISSNAFRVISHIISAYGDDGLIKFKRRTLAAYCQFSEQVLDRAIIEIKKAGLIRYQSTGRCLQFWLTDLCWPDANKPRSIEPENHQQQRNRVITSNETPNIGIKRNIKKEKTTTPAIKPKPKPKPEPKPEQPGKKIDAVNLENYKKSIHPDIIADGLNDETILKVCDGADCEKIIYASDKALRPDVKNKAGYFVRMMQLKVFKMQKKLDNGLETVAIPKDIDGNCPQMKKIICYNRNALNLTCTSILGTAPVNKECLKFCPFYVQRMEQELQLYQKICAEIIRETDKAFLIRPMDSINDHWIPKSVIKKRESYGDDNFLFTIPKSFKLKNDECSPKKGDKK